HNSLECIWKRVSNTTPGPATLLLAAYRGGNVDSIRELMEIVAPELRRIAGCLMRRERSDHILRPTGLVNEAFLRLFNGRQIPFENSEELFAASVRCMRNVLTDHARRNLARKRQEPDVPPSAGVETGLTPEELIDLSRALDELEEHEPRAARIV